MTAAVVLVHKLARTNIAAKFSGQMCSCCGVPVISSSQQKSSHAGCYKRSYLCNSCQSDAMRACKKSLNTEHVHHIQICHLQRAHAQLCMGVEYKD